MMASSLDEARFRLAMVPAAGVTLAEAEAAMDEVMTRFPGRRRECRRLSPASRPRLRAREIYARDNAGGLARRYGAALAIGLTVADVQDWPAVLQAVTEADVMAAAREVLDRRQRRHRLVDQPRRRRAMRPCFVCIAALLGAGHAAARRSGDSRRSPRPVASRPGWSKNMAFPLPRWKFAFAGGTSLDAPGKRGAVNLMTALIEEGAGDLDAQGFAAARDALAAEFSFRAGQDARVGFGRIPDRKPRSGGGPVARGADRTAL